MDGRILIILIVVVLLVFAAILGAIEDKKQKDLQYKKIKQNFGKRRKVREIKEPLIFKHHISNDFYLDDITASDVELNKVFSVVDHTYTAPGREYLYYRLRYPLSNLSKNTEMEALIDAIGRNADQLYSILYILSTTGNIDKDINDYLTDLKFPAKMLFKHFLPLILFILSIVLIIFRAEIGIALLIFTACFGIITYFSAKKVLNDGIKTCFYIINLCNLSLRLSKVKASSLVLQNFLDKLKSTGLEIKRTIRGAFYVFLSADNNKNMLSMITDYINMLFHFDIILFYFLDKNIKKQKESIISLFENIGILDYAISIASYRASLEVYCKPEFCNESLCEGLYHPLIVNAVENDFNPLDYTLITGSNASGKSTYLKSAALAVIMGEGINTVCAKNYKAPLLRPFTSMALKDNLLNNESFFLAEIRSIKRIIDNAQGKEPAIAFIDEILKGTNTIERISASSSLAKDMKEKGIYLTFATHDIELCSILKRIYKNVHFTETMSGDDINFTYKLCEGPSITRNALTLMRISEFDTNVIENAKSLVDNFEKNNIWKEL